MNKLSISCVILIFLLLTSLLTYPLIFNIARFIPGFFSTDEPFGILWASWRIKFSLLNRLPLLHTTLIAYPLGVNPYASGLFSNLWTVVFMAISLFTNPVITYNAHILVNFLLCAVFTCLLVRRITGSAPAAFFSGMAFAFCPYQFVRSWQHLGLTFNGWIPLCILSALALREKLSRRAFFLFSLTILLIFSFDLVVMYLTFIALAAFLSYTFFYHWRVKFFKDRQAFINDIKYLKSVFLAGLLAFIFVLPQFFFIIRNRLLLSSSTPAGVYNYFRRPFEDLFTQSARPLSYFLPATVHPISGKFTESFIGTKWYGDSFTEHTLYLGWTPLILAFVAFRRWRRNRSSQVTSYKLQATDRENFYVGFFVFLALMAWLFSQPPWWNVFGFKIYMPSFFMYKILPMFRAYCRFGIVVMLSVAVLAGFGLKFILERFKSQKTKLAVTVLFCGLVLFEFWNWPPYKVIDLSKAPAVYYWLKDEPEDIVIAEYPLDADSPNELYKFFQTVHEKKIVNGTIPGTYANKIAQEIRRLSQPKTASHLKWMGVKYVIVHKDDYLKTDLVEDKEDLARIPQNPGIKFLKAFSPQECPDKDIMCVQKSGPIDVYEVVAETMEPRIEE